VQFAHGGQAVGGFCDESVAIRSGAPMVLRARRSASTVHRLLVLNLLLQVFDGLATYGGMQVGFGERNPLLRLAFASWGIAPTLLFCKSLACVTLVVISFTASRRLAATAFSLVAGVYGIGSFIPWMWGFGLWLASSL
jgi:uncharacterized protein DUF5658